MIFYFIIRVMDILNTKGGNIMAIKGAIFDMDGTFIDSMSKWYGLPSQYVRDLGMSPEEGLDDKMRALGFREGLEYLIETYNVKETPEAIHQKILKVIADFYKSDAPLRIGAIKLFDEFKARGVSMCVATATDEHLASPALKRLDLYKYFSAVFTCRGVGAHKNEPLIYEESLKHLGTKKEETLVFEDALHAIKTAKKAGFKVVAIYDDSSKKDWEEIKALSDYTIMSLEEFNFDILN